MTGAYSFRIIPKDAEVIGQRWVSPRVASDAYLPSEETTSSADWSEQEWTQFSRRFHGLIARMCIRARPHVDSEMYKDCQQEADILLWQLRHKLSALPEGNREAYASLCVRRRALRSLSAEMQRRRRISSITAAGGWDYLPETVPGAINEAATITASCPPAGDIPGSAGDLLTQLNDTVLLNVLKHLPSHDYDIINLFFGWGMTDAEIGHYLGKTSSMVKARRTRALTRLRRALTGTPA